MKGHCKLNEASALAGLPGPGAENAAQRLLVGVGPSSEAGHTIQWAHRLASALGCPWIALHVVADKEDSEDETQLARSLDLARKLGAETLTTADDDVVRGLTRVALQRGATHLVVGKCASRPGWGGGRSDRVGFRLLQNSGGLQIHVAGGSGQPPDASRKAGMHRPPLGQYLAVIGTVAAVTGAAFLFTPIVGAHATALVFLLTIVVLALFVDRGPALFAAALSAISWDYFFLPPLFAFRIYRFEDAMLFVMYFVVALALGQLTARNKAQQQQEKEREARATALYLLTRELNEAKILDEILDTAKTQIETAFQSETAITLHLTGDPLLQHNVGRPAAEWERPEIAAWVAKNGSPAGKSTNEFANAQAIYVPLHNSAGTIGAVGLRLAETRTVSLHQRTLLESFSEQIALALDRLRLRELSEQARLLRESERLSKMLLNSMSHELKTPIAVITGAVETLVELRKARTPDLPDQIVAEIREAADRLNHLVGNALELNRLESGSVQPIIVECDPAELVHLCCEETEGRLARHEVHVEISPDLPITKMDFVLTQMALVNLLANAAMHTPARTRVDVCARVESEELVISVADRGPGLEDNLLPRIFDKFVRAPDAPAGGTGLGLSLVKGFVEAQGGTVSAENRSGGGAIFGIRLPLRKAAPAPAVPIPMHA